MWLPKKLTLSSAAKIRNTVIQNTSDNIFRSVPYHTLKNEGFKEGQQNRKMQLC